MAVAIEGMRWALLGQGTPPGQSLAVAWGLALALLLLGGLLFKRSERTIVDML